MSALSALVSAYGDSGDEADSPRPTPTNRILVDPKEAAERSALDALFQRVDEALGFDSHLPPAVYSADTEFGERVRQNERRAREMGMGMTEYVRTKGNFNNPELIKLLRSQLPYTLPEYATNLPDLVLDPRFLGSTLIKEQDRTKREKDQERARRDREAKAAAEAAPPPRSGPAGRYLAAATPGLEMPDPLRASDPPGPGGSPSSNPRAPLSGPPPVRSPHSAPEAPAPTLPPPVSPISGPSPSATFAPSDLATLVPPPSSPPPTATPSVAAVPSAGPLFDGILTDRQRLALANPGVMAQLPLVEQQSLLAAIREASQKLATEARGSEASRTTSRRDAATPPPPPPPKRTKSIP